MIGAKRVDREQRDVGTRTSVPQLEPVGGENGPLDGRTAGADEAVAHERAAAESARQAVALLERGDGRRQLDEAEGSAPLVPGRVDGSDAEPARMRRAGQHAARQARAGE